jgi:broad specificity phosphatase PhoE
MRVPIRPPAIPDDPSSPTPPPIAPLGTSARVWLLRHADVHDDWQKKAYGNLDVPLSEEGLRQTSVLADAFARVGFERIASSPLSRARRLGEELAERSGAPLRVDDRLREVWRGTWQGLPVDEFRARWEKDREAFAADPWNWKGHGGESDAEIWARAWPALSEAALAARAAADGPPALAITSHYNVIRVLATRLAGWRPSRSFAFRNEPAHASLLLDTPRGWVLERANVETPTTEPPRRS